MDRKISQYPAVPFGELSWCHQNGVLYQKDMSVSVEYGKEYFEKYVRYENTDIANKLNEGRTAITEKYCISLLDIGIGSGEFIKESKIRVYGFDINPVGVTWLKRQGLYVDPYQSMPDVGGLTFWDSLEHIPNPHELLDIVLKDQYLFVSMPVFDNLLKVRSSKHYRPNEHYYYFTTEGLCSWMDDYGFSLVEVSDFETRAGREDIFTYVFVKN